MLKAAEGGVQVQQGNDSVIPAVPGEFYYYGAEFTTERPLYGLMKCKSNKARPLAAAFELGSEINLVFLFEDMDQAQVCAVEVAQAYGLLGGIGEGKQFGETWIAPAGITVEDFREISSSRDVPALVRACQRACSGRGASLALRPDAVIAMMTLSGKYGLFFAKEITQSSIKIDACHILL